MDIAAMVERIRGHRFDGYTPNGIADEIDKFRSGGGVGGIGEAVDAMKAVATELAETDKTLREELAKLGVAWTSGAGGRASAVLVEQAGFSSDAGDKVTQSAELIFAQGEAFTRTLHKLPESSAIRAGSGGYSVGDGLMSLIGYETDHAKAVKASREAKEQAVGVLNDYAKASGDNLSWTEALNAPEALNLAGTPGGPSPLDIGTQAANVHAGGSPIDDCPPTSGGKGSMPTTKSGAGSFDPPTPPMGIPAQPQGGSRPGVSIPDSSTAPSGATPPAAAPPAAAPPVAGGPVVPGRPPQHGSPNQPGPTHPGVPGAPGVPHAPGGIGQTPPGGQSGGKPFPGGIGTPVSPGTPGAPGSTGGYAGKLGGLAGGGAGADNLVGGKGGAPGGGAADGPLGKGKVFGSGPQAPTPQSVGGGFTAVPKPGGVGDFASGAAALGAGAVGGAMAGGDGDRRGRGVGRGGSPGAFPRVNQVPMGDLPEEEARALRRSGQGGETDKRRGFLEQAATQDGEHDAEHVRKFGIDDKDLFTDQRMVAPDVIGRDDAGDAR
ncbi:hypothetical protein [Amycolatopsis magusensis]|uniref:PPE family protein n=1 Tax=Amycolatopsis magusensis TaxID=882444 RepID=A0ABS4PKU1_9PSEU|nr:hypothetical protein [Amycolatopsis magusensis]MBP2180030.1 hypothetical protein [Amycolatopsis magusensis]